MNEKYKEYLQSGEWKHLEGIKLNNTKYTCEGCNETGRVLEVHHLTYERIGMELLTDLVVYCTECHKVAHGKAKQTEWNKYLDNETNDKPKEQSVKDIEFNKMLDSI